MASKRKQLDAKAKAKRQKVIAGALGVVLLGVLAFEVPKMMKLSHHSSTSSAASTTPVTPATPGATPAAAGAPGSTAAVTSLASLAKDGVKLTAGEGQLTSFNRFAAKDPFAQQVTSDSSGSTSSSPTSGGSLPLPSAPVTVPAPASSPGLTSVPPTTGSSGNAGTPTPAPTQAVISVNGQSETVAGPSYNFPASDPMFHAKIERSVVKVTIVGGSFASGAPAITLKLHKPITLVNTATGIRYRLELLSLSSSSTSN